MSVQKRKMGNFIINPKFQLKYIFFLTVSGLSLVTMYGVIAYVFIKENYEILVDLADIEDEVKVQLYSELTQMIYWMVASSAVFMTLVFITGIVFSHRVAGPLYRMRKTFDAITDGSQTDYSMSFRPNDEFQELAEGFNNVVSKITKK